MSQKEQKKIIEEFSENKINILVATCIAEEGFPLSDLETHPENACYARCEAECTDGGPNKPCKDKDYNSFNAGIYIFIFK